jgi:hypothetical protein
MKKPNFTNAELCIIRDLIIYINAFEGKDKITEKIKAKIVKYTDIIGDVDYAKLQE